MGIPFNRVASTLREKKYVNDAIDSGALCGGGSFEKSCNTWFREHLGAKNVLMTPSCTHALEMMALLIDIREGDEVIMPSYTFVSTANAFALRGANIVFVDIRADTLNINELLIESAITEKTKAIVVVHYAGVACEMDSIMAIAEQYNLYVLEDAAQAIMSKYKNQYLGTIGHLGAFSFHETKNITSGGEGGLLLINDGSFIDRAEIIREKGTNRKQFLDGHIDKYSWVDIGSSYLSTELQSAFLLAQLESAAEITKKRLELWTVYHSALRELEAVGLVQLQHIPVPCEQNGHIFYILLRDHNERSKLIEFLKMHGINSVFHYIPLHSSPFGERISRFHGSDTFTTSHSKRLLRLPLFSSLKLAEVESISSHIKSFFAQQG